KMSSDTSFSVIVVATTLPSASCFSTTTDVRAGTNGFCESTPSAPLKRGKSKTTNDPTSASRKTIAAKRFATGRVVRPVGGGGSGVFNAGTAAATVAIQGHSRSGAGRDPTKDG